MTTSEILMAYLTAVIAVTGVLGAIIFNRQLAAMQGQLEEMKAASALQREQTALQKEQMRGRVFVDTGDGTVTIGKSISINLLLKNSGPTPAYNLAVWSRAEILDYPLKKPLEFVDPEGDKPNILITPGIPFGITVGRDAPLSEGEAAAIHGATATRRLFLWGRVVYKDVFNVEHHRTFCLKFGGNDGPRDKLVWCEQGNDES